MTDFTLATNLSAFLDEGDTYSFAVTPKAALGVAVKILSLIHI